MIAPTHLELLQRTFGFSTLRPEQEPVIEHVLAKKDSLVLMPTGGGKSLCYQFPAICMEGTTIVISPLIALMKDQVDALKLHGISAAYVNSTLDPAQEQATLHALKSGGLDLLYLAPERLFHRGGHFLSVLEQLDISLFAIDETHCISQWGHDFRPDYVMLSQLKKRFPSVPMIALTATADSQTRKDILKQLGMDEPKVFISSFDRANIKYTVRPKKNYLGKLLSFLDQYKNESGIIYCLSRKRTEEVAEVLRGEGVDALPYHAGLNPQVRASTQEKFIKDEVKIIVATIAFGMGIDKSNVRFVVHIDLPKNIEGYYQETGRAGRDGLPSEALLFYGAGDYFMLSRFCTVEGNPEQSEILLNKLRRMVDYADSTICRRKNLLNYFDEKHEGSCDNCDNCLTERSTFDATVNAQKLLSTIARLDRPYGLSHCLKILRGSRSEKIPPSHRELSTFGIGKEDSMEHWSNIGKEMIQLGLMTLSIGQYPTLSLNNKSWEVLHGKLKVELTERAIELEVEHVAPDYDKELFDLLKTERLAIARSLNLPAYAVLPDNSLMELATYLPFEEEDLMSITGFGSVKVKRYGGKFLRVIREQAKSAGLKSRMAEKTGRGSRKRSPKKKTEESLSNTAIITLQMYNRGMSEEQIATERELNPRTILSHLSGAVRMKKLPVEKFVNKQELDVISPIFELYPGMGLKIIFDHLKERYSYEKIRFVEAYLSSLPLLEKS